MKYGIKKLKNFELTVESCEILLKMKATSGKPESHLVDDLIRRADQILTPVESNPILSALIEVNEKLDELLKR